MAGPQPPPYPGYPPAYPPQPYYSPQPQAPGTYAPPYYGTPPYPPFLPPPKKESNVLAIVLVVVLVLIAATVVLAAVFYVMVTGLTTGPPPNGAPTLTLAAGQWNNENLTIQITFVSSSTLAFPDLTFQVLSRTAAVCFLGAANGASQNRCAGAAVAVIYVDAQGDGRVDTLDSIRISASPNNEVRGGSLRVSLGGHTLTAITLP